jgi:hypothetical protein
LPSFFLLTNHHKKYLRLVIKKKISKMKVWALIFAALLSLVDGQAPMEPDVTAVDYRHLDDALQGFYAKPEGDGPFPGVVIIP